MNRVRNKGVRVLKQEQNKVMAEMRDRGKSWGQCALRFNINRSVARKRVLNYLSKQEIAS